MSCSKLSLGYSKFQTPPPRGGGRKTRSLLRLHTSKLLINGVGQHPGRVLLRKDTAPAPTVAGPQIPQLPGRSPVQEQVATSSSKPETSHALNHDLLKTLNLVTPKSRAKALAKAWETMPELPGALSRRTRAQTSVHPPAGGRVRYSPRRRPAPSRRHPGDGEQPARAARKEAQGQREARGRRGPEQPTSGSQEGSHGSGCPSREARSCRGPGGTRDDGVAPEWDGPTAKRRGGWSLAKAHRRREPNSLGHPDHFFALQQ